MDSGRRLNQALVDIEDKYYSFPLIREWAIEYTYHVVALTILYVFFIHLGVRAMENRLKFELRTMLVCWNSGLAWYSIYSFWQFVPGLLAAESVGDAICDVTYMHKSGGMWTWMFTLSKIAELGDTFFVVAKKKKLIFLHWFHHITVLWFCWFSYISPHGPGRIYAVINMLIHTVMYLYYGIAASGLYRPPKWINVTITTMQLSQMLVGISTTLWSFHLRRSGYDCAMSDTQFAVSMMLYGSYTILFGNFFIQSYLRRKVPSK